jgi:hypothetical protein
MTYCATANKRTPVENGRCWGVKVRISRIEFRVRPRPRDWAVELWQWPNQEFVKQHKVKTALVAIQIGPVEVRFWIGRPGQYEIVPEEATDGDEPCAATRPLGLASPLSAL